MVAENFLELMLVASGRCKDVSNSAKNSLHVGIALAHHIVEVAHHSNQILQSPLQ